jgi:hypothetical protein
LLDIAETDHFTASAVSTTVQPTGLRLEWTWLMALLVGSILFVPAQIYTLPVSLPFELDVYRLVLVCLLTLWAFALLSASPHGLRSTGLEGPLILFSCAVVASLVSNLSRVDLYQGEVVKTVAIFVSLALTLYLTVSVVDKLEVAETLLRILVLGGATLGVLAVIESRVGLNPFQNLDDYLPFLQAAPFEFMLEQRGSHFRASASAEHPIALGALLALLAPISAALAVRTQKALWWLALGCLVVGAVSTVSRTAVLMLVAGFALLCALRWDESKRFVPLAFVVLALTHFAVPGTLGTLRQGLAPSFLVADQQTSAESLRAGGRLTDLHPSYEEFRAKPWFGYGAGTRIVYGERVNSRILDNQWLASLLEIGLVGAIALAWLFARFITRLARVSAGAAPGDATLLAALAASAFAYAVGMMFFDAFSFVQVTLVMVLLLAVGCSLGLAKDRVFHALPDPAMPTRQVRREGIRARLSRLGARRRTRVASQMDRVREYQSGRFDDTTRS